MEEQARASRPARFIAVGNRINLAAAHSEASFMAELERHSLIQQEAAI